MDMQNRKRILQEWKDRRPEMGIISFKSTKTDENFLGISKDTKASFNSNRFQLSMGLHPNKRMTQLWNQYGDEVFECSVVKILKYENPNDDHTEELEKLMEQCLEVDSNAKRI